MTSSGLEVVRSGRSDSAPNGARLAESGFTQPQFWLLRHLSGNDLSADGRGLTIAEVRRAMSSYLRHEDDLAADAAVLAERGCLRRDGEGRWWLTAAGERAGLGTKKHAPAIRAQIHRGIDDTDYVTTLKVLQRMIDNTNAEPDFAER